MTGQLASHLVRGANSRTFAHSGTVVNDKGSDFIFISHFELVVFGLGEEGRELNATTVFGFFMARTKQLAVALQYEVSVVSRKSHCDRKNPVLNLTESCRKLVPARHERHIPSQNYQRQVGLARHLSF